MLRTLTEENNGIHVKCEKLTCDNLPTFAGITLSSVADIVQRNAADILSGEKIIVGDGTNKVKDSNIDATSDHINFPLDKGYWINSQPILYQDNTDSSKYKFEVHSGKLNDASNQLTITPGGVGFNIALNATNPAANRVYSLPDAGADADFVMSAGAQNVAGIKTFSDGITTNSITSVGENDDLTIDANGTGIVYVNSLVEGGIQFQSATNNSWTYLLKSSVDDTRLAMGIRQPSGARKPTISGISPDFATYHPIWLGALDSTTPTIMGNVESSVATALSAKLYVDGVTVSSGNILAGGDVVVKKATSTSGTITGTFTGNRTFTLPDTDGTIALTGGAAQIVANYTSDLTGFAIDGTAKQLFVFTGTTFSKLLAYVNIDSGTTFRFRVYDNSTATVILEGFLAGSGSNAIWTMDNVVNAPAGSVRPFYVDVTRTEGSGTGSIFAINIEA